MIKHTYTQIKDDTGTTKVQLVIVTGFVLLFWLSGNIHFVYAAAGIGLASLLTPPIGKGIVWVWYKIAEILGIINARIILSVLYYLFVTPLALLFRLSGNDPLLLKQPDKTVYQTKEKTYQADDLKNPW